MLPSAESSPDVKKPGEPHRIYWQQWIVGNSNSSTSSDGTTSAAAPPQEERLSRRELITSSAAVRLSRAAKASDLTALLRKSLLLPEPSTTGDDGGTSESLTSPHDSLVLVGTLYSLPRNYIQFEHEPMGNQSDRAFSDDTFHVVRTLHPSDSPLAARDEMELYLSRYLKRSEAMMAAKAKPQSHRSNDSLVAGMFPSTLSNDLPFSSTHSVGSSRHDAPRCTSTAIITPKLQWYFVPASVHVPQNTTTPQAMIPNCVELDGYSTAIEEEDDDNDNNNETSDNDDDDDDSISTAQSRSESGFEHVPFEENIYQSMAREFPWLSAPTDTAPQRNQRTDKMSRRLQRETRRLFEYSTQSSSCANKITGYLLKQDMRDPNVWRRMYCTLTHHELWFVTRVYTEASSSTPPSQSEHSEVGDSNEEQESNDSQQCISFSKHSRITLTRALLVEPTAGYAPLFRTPYAFEIVSSRGTPHVFRANSKQVQRMWITALSDRIVQSYESSLMQHADLIVIDQCLARSRRTNASAVTPLWAEAVRVANNHQQSDKSPSESQKKRSALATTSKPLIGNSIGSVLRWGMDVALYRDQCRYIASSMPAKSPVLVVTPPRRRFFSSTRYRTGSAGNSSDVPVSLPTEPNDSFDPVMRNMILATWDHAGALLARATSLALTLQVRSSIKQFNDVDGISSGEPVKLSNGIDTMCRHIEFVITGKSVLSKGSSHNSSSSMSNNDSGTGKLESDVQCKSQNRQPPEDLFDHLLGELQSLAALADRQIYHRDLAGSR